MDNEKGCHRDLLTFKLIYWLQDSEWFIVPCFWAMRHTSKLSNIWTINQAIKLLIVECQSLKIVQALLYLLYCNFSCLEITKFWLRVLITTETFHFRSLSCSPISWLLLLFLIARWLWRDECYVLLWLERRNVHYRWLWFRFHHSRYSRFLLPVFSPIFCSRDGSYTPTKQKEKGELVLLNLRIPLSIDESIANSTICVLFDANIVKRSSNDLPIKKAKYRLWFQRLTNPPLTTFAVQIVIFTSLRVSLLAPSGEFIDWLRL